MRYGIALLLALSLSATTFAQYGRDGRHHHQREVEHTFGIQINELFRQIFNFNGNPGSPEPFPTRNPYLITYSINSRAKGWGVRSGLGYYYAHQPQTWLGGYQKSETTEIRARLGLEKSFRIAGKWMTGVGADFVWNHDRQVYESSNWGNSGPVIVPDTTFNKSFRRSMTFGGGPTAWLRYNITPRVLIGTEANFYYYDGEEKIDEETRFVRQSGTPIPTRTISAEDDIREARLTLPVAIFILVRF